MFNKLEYCKNYNHTWSDWFGDTLKHRKRYCKKCFSFQYQPLTVTQIISHSIKNLFK